MIWHNKETQWQSFWKNQKVINASLNILNYSQRWSMPPQIFSIILKGDQCLLKYSQIFSKVINASSNILIYWFVGGAFREHFTKIFQVKTWSTTSSSFIIIITIKNNRHIKFTNTIMNNIIIITNAISWCLPRGLSQDLSRSKRSSAALQWGFKGEHSNT